MLGEFGLYAGRNALCSRAALLRLPEFPLVAADSRPSTREIMAEISWEQKQGEQ